MAEHARPAAEAKKQSEEVPEESNPLEFAAAAYKWVSSADKEIVEMVEQAGAPALAIDAHVLQQLSRIRMFLADVMADLGAQLPEDQRPAS